MKKLLYLAACLLIIASCKKDDSKTPTQHLTSHAWKMTDRYIDGSPAGIDTCEWDDLWVFNTDGTGMVDIGTDKCDTNQADYGLIWQFSGANDTLYVQIGTFYQVFRVHGISDDKMDLESDFNGADYRFIFRKP